MIVKGVSAEDAPLVFQLRGEKAKVKSKVPAAQVFINFVRNNVILNVVKDLLRDGTPSTHCRFSASRRSFVSLRMTIRRTCGALRARFIMGSMGSYGFRGVIWLGGALTSRPYPIRTY